MNWTNVACDLAPRRVTSLLATLPSTDALILLARMHRDPVVLFDETCRTGILEHLQTRRIELGGLLLGRPFVPDASFPASFGPLVCVEDFLPSRDSKSSRISLAMGTEIWNRAREAIAKEERMIVGWYHSHPNLGAFFSSTDRATQKAFFNKAYSVGLVIDPIRNEEAWFVGPDSISARATHLGERKNPL